MTGGVFFSNNQSDHWWAVVVADVAAALARQNCPCDIIAPPTPDQLIPQMQQAQARNPGFAASFNGRVTWIAHVQQDLGKAVLPNDLIDAPPVDILLDHPVHEAGVIKSLEDAARKRPHLPAPRYGIMDPDHLTCIMDLGVPGDRVFLFPQGGPPADPAPRPMTDRPIPFIFHGSIPEPESDECFYDRIQLPSGQGRDLMQGVIDQVLRDQTDPYVGAKAALALLGHNSPLAAAQMAIDIDLRARRLRRWRMLSALRHLPIHFCGDICQTFRQENPNGIYMGVQTFAQVRSLVGQSRIMLNETINLRHAALFRLHYAMADGCVVATQRNEGLAAHFTHNRDVIFLDRGEDLARLADDLPRLQAMADQAALTHNAGHLWDHRVTGLLERR